MGLFNDGVTTERPKPQYELSISVEIRDPQQGYTGLRVQEQVKITAESFMEVAAVLAKFHELANALQK